MLPLVHIIRLMKRLVIKGYRHMPIKQTKEITKYEMILVSKLASDGKIGIPNPALQHALRKLKSRTYHKLKLFHFYSAVSHYILLSASFCLNLN
jgi:hypothetical protein